MTASAYKLVIFDCDGVLIDSERLAVKFDREIFGRYGWDVTEQFIADRYLGVTYRFMISELIEQVGELPPDFDEKYNQGLHALFDAELTAVDGVAGAIDAIHAAGLATCVASSSSHERLRYSLGHTGLLDRFDGHIFSASEVERGKPAPDLFQHAARTMGFEPASCAVIEDSEFGVQAARSAEMDAFAFASGLIPPERLDGPGTTRFTSMGELPALLGLSQ